MVEEEFPPNMFAEVGVVEKEVEFVPEGAELKGELPVPNIPDVEGVFEPKLAVGVAKAGEDEVVPLLEEKMFEALVDDGTVDFVRSKADEVDFSAF